MEKSDEIILKERLINAIKLKDLHATQLCLNEFHSLKLSLDFEFNGRSVVFHAVESGLSETVELLLHKGMFLYCFVLLV